MRLTVVLTTAFLLSSTSCSGADDEPSPAPDDAATTAVVATTAPGTDLGFGEPATLVWQPASTVSGTLELSVDEVAEQRMSVFDGWLRDDVVTETRPYFVTVTVANAGESDLAGQVVPLYLRDDNGTLGAPWTMGGDFTACQSGPLPSPFGPGTEAELCLVYLVPEGGRIEDMVFEPTEGYDPISWTGDVATPEKATRKTAEQERGDG